MGTFHQLYADGVFEALFRWPFEPLLQLSALLAFHRTELRRFSESFGTPGWTEAHYRQELQPDARATAFWA